MTDVACLWLYLGVKAKARMSIPGTSRPKIEYISGLLEFLQARHQMIEKMTAMMMIKVPIPIPRILEEVVVWA